MDSFKTGRKLLPYKGRARNNFNISPHSSASKSTRSDLAQNPNAQINLNKKMRALQKAQKTADRVENFPDGRIRYYTTETPSKKVGPTRGRSYVTEFNSKTGQVRAWSECYDHQGNVNRVRPKMLDGQDLRAQHYPPTKDELIKSLKKIGRPK